MLRAAMLVLLILVSALLHALWNAILKREPDKGVGGVAVLAIATLLAAVTALALWASAGRPPFPGDGLAWSAAAGVFEAGYFLTLVRALERAPLGVAYTVSRGVAILAVWPISAVWLGERATLVALAGAALLCVGLAAASVEGRVRSAGLGVAVACGLFIAGYHLAYKQALAGGGEPAAVFALSLAVALPVNFVALGPARRPQVLAQLRARPLRLLGAGLVCGGSFLLFLVALAGGPAGLVLTLRNTSVLFAVLLAWALGDAPTRRQVIGAALVAVGAALLGLAR